MLWLFIVPACSIRPRRHYAAMFSSLLRVDQEEKQRERNRRHFRMSGIAMLYSVSTMLVLFTVTPAFTIGRPTLAAVVVASTEMSPSAGQGRRLDEQAASLRPRPEMRKRSGTLKFLNVTEPLRQARASVHRCGREVASSRRSLQLGPGSSLPSCSGKCGLCSPCKPVHVAIGSRHEVISETEYYPEVWRCQCGNKLFQP